MDPGISPSEVKKRRRERRIALLITVGFVASTLLQAALTARRQAYGFVQSLLYFGLIHLNLILIMLLVFLVSRTLVKAYLVRRSGRLGGSLRWRLVTSLLAFSLLPSLLLFAGSSSIIRQGFDRWFGTQVARALEDAQAIANVHYSGIEHDLEFFSKLAEAELREQTHTPNPRKVESLKGRFPVQAIELYTDLVSQPVRILDPSLQDWAVPRAAVESLQRAFAGEPFDLIRQYGDGDLVQRFFFVHAPPSAEWSAPGGQHIPGVVVVLSETVSLGLKTRIDDLRRAFAGYQKTALLKEDLKTTYTLVLLTLFLLTMFVVSWFGLYIARSVTDPVAELLKGTEAFREGRWDYRMPTSFRVSAKGDGSQSLRGPGADLEVLKAAFNLMAEEVGRRGRQLEEANAQLISLVRELEDRERYLEILFSSIRRGVLVIDTGGFIRRINREALAFAVPRFQGPAPEVLGQHWREVFARLGVEEDVEAWLDETAGRRGESVDRLFDLNLEGEGSRAISVVSIRATGIQLRDERGHAFGWMIILEDVSDAARLEKLAAWQEVARRVAHEIKNPLTPIQISVDRLYRRMYERMETDERDGPVFRECVRQIQKQVRVIRDLVREFSEFSKLPEPKFSAVPVRDLIEDILKDYRFTHPQCQFSFEARDDARPLVRADSEYLRRLFVNLTDNALQSLEASRTPAPRFNVTLDVSEDFVAIVFEDNGPGISASMREKIFDPYVTSKASGLGLGLAIVRRIAMEHMGRVRCEEAPGGRFVLELPLLAKGDSPLL
jgi:two-component system nitrogen regulation sensor histidine kinase NtrY